MAPVTTCLLCGSERVVASLYPHFLLCEWEQEFLPHRLVERVQEEVINAWSLVGADTQVFSREHLEEAPENLHGCTILVFVF